MCQSGRRQTESRVSELYNLWRIAVINHYRHVQVCYRFSKGIIYKAAIKAANPSAPKTPACAIAVCTAPESAAVVAAAPLCELCALSELVSRSLPTAVGTIWPSEVFEVVYVTFPPELSGVGMAAT